MIEELIKSLTEFNDSIPSIIAQVIKDGEDGILEKVRSQLWDGKTPEGKDITPSYLADPYFKTPQQAKAYVAWKEQITPNPDRNPISPNLFINGYFHSTLSIDYDEEGFIITNNTHLGQSVIMKYGYETFGLSEDYLLMLQQEILNRLSEKWNTLMT